MSQQRPIQKSPRDAHSQAQGQAQLLDGERFYSNGKDSFILDRGDKEEDEFHRRLHLRRESSGNFWRRSNSAREFAGPSFSSMSMKQRQENVSDRQRTAEKPGFLLKTSPSGHGDQSKFLSHGRKIEETGRIRESKNPNMQRSNDRALKLEAHSSDIDLGHLEGKELKLQATEGSLGSVSRGSSSDNSGLLYGKTLTSARSGALLGKSTSLIFPTGVEGRGQESGQSGSENKIQEINHRLNACENVRWPKKKKLVLENMRLLHTDIPVKFLAGTSLGNSLYKLSLSGNRLKTIPKKLVQSLPMLKHLDLSQCELASIPDAWSLPQLKKLNLSHNKLAEFPEENILEGLPELVDLNMYGNKVTEIIIPRTSKALGKLELLDLGYNEMAYLPDELAQLKSLRTLKVMNNFLERVPVKVCEMDLKTIDVSGNPVIQPPIETCERGISSMKRYYQCLKQEEQSKTKTLDEMKKGKREDKKKFGKMNRLFLLKSTSDLGKNDKDNRKITRSVQLSQASQGSIEEPIISSVRSKPPTMGRRRSLSFDEGIKKLDENDRSGNLVNLNTGNRFSKKNEMANEVTSLFQGPDHPPAYKQIIDQPEDAVVNDTLKVIFVGMAMTGKTSIIRRLIEGKHAVIPERDDRTIGVDIYQWDPHNNKDRPFVDCRIDVEDKTFTRDVDVKFSVWDFAGQQVYHATHELFFSPHALYVIVWDMGATNEATHRRKIVVQDQGDFGLRYDSSDEEDDDAFVLEEERRRAEKALERDIDEKVQFWVECIESCAPGAAILPVASFNDKFSQNEEEAKRRCNMMKQRLLRHEERRVAGIKDRLNKYADENRANDEAALRLKKLTCTYTRPKLIFGWGESDSVIRVSGTEYTGFDTLTQKIVMVATGRDKVGSKYPVFRGHVGARIPRMRLKVRDVVREMRDKFKVVEWGYFISTLESRGLTNVEHIGDALHFLTNTGELSYFGMDHIYRLRSSADASANGSRFTKMNDNEYQIHQSLNTQMGLFATYDDEMDIDEDDDNGLSSIDDTSLTFPTIEDDNSLSTFDDYNPSNLSQYIFLNPRWLVAAVACILRHDLDRELREARRAFSNESKSDSVYDGNLNCPVITAADALMLWQAKKFTKKAADRAQEYSNNMRITPFVFLQRLLIRFGVFVPIDLNIDKTFLGGREYSINIHGSHQPPVTVIETKKEQAPESHFFFLPSLLGPGEPAEAWTYKNTDSWKTTLCHSIFFPDGVPPGLMERVTASVLSTVYAVSKGGEHVVRSSIHNKGTKTVDGPLRVKEVLCWRTAFFLKLGNEVRNENGEIKESVVEIFAHLVDHDSHLCVGSDFMGAGMRRLVMSAKGQVGDFGRKIWRGGYLLVLKSVFQIMAEYGGLEYEKQGFCPECLTKKAVSEASAWDWSVMCDAVKHGVSTMRCRHGHMIDTPLVTGPQKNSIPKKSAETIMHSSKYDNSEPVVPVNDLLRGIVLVGLWDGKLKKIVRVGSGFVADKKRGLIVTASHTLMNIWGEKSTPFGEDYYGLRDGKVVIGVIPRQKDTENKSTEAFFRYFARIIVKDPCIEEKGECHLDACVLRITTKMEYDIGGNGDGCSDQPEILLLNNQDALRRERLQQLKITEKCELDEQVRILGYNQGGEGLLGPGENLNRYFDFARGYVCKKFAGGQDACGYLHRFKPHEEIVVICPTIGGHSGGPCVNQQGEVIGILSRADPAEKQRCYLVPSYEWKALVKQAKNLC